MPMPMTELTEDPLTVLVRLLDAIVDRLADELESAGREIETISTQIFEHRRRSSGAAIRNCRYEALMLRIGKVQRLLAETARKLGQHQPDAGLPRHRST